MEETRHRSILSTLITAAIALWLLFRTAELLLLFFFSLVLAIAVNVPVTALEHRGWRRGAAALVVFVAIATVIAALGWLVLPRIGEQLADLTHTLPQYIYDAKERATEWLARYPDLQHALRSGGGEDALPSATTILQHAGSVSVSIVTALVSLLVVVSVTAYAVLRPRALLNGYLGLFPEALREKAADAYSESARMIIGWIWSNVVVGSLEAVASGVVLTLLGVPAALVWAALAFFAELVPKIGTYLMAIPPIIVAFSVSPMTAIWVAVFYIVQSEIMGDFVAPYVRGKTMELHPVWVLFVTLALAATFGLAGALVGTPLTGVIAAFCTTFRKTPPPTSSLVERMLAREKTPAR
jgi:predicted PurR-regulated permease PerM